MNYWSLGCEIQSPISLRLAPSTASIPAASISILPDAQFHHLLHRVAKERHIAHHNAQQRTQVTLLSFDEHTCGVEFKRGTDCVRFAHSLGTQRITYAHTTPLPNIDLAAIIEGPVIGWYLRLQHRPLLHAAALRWGEQILAISAEPGTGKSTLAALLCAHGGEHWSDDIVVYDPTHATAIADARPRRLSREARNLHSQASAEASSMDTEIFTDSPKIFTTPVPELTDALQTPQPLGHVLILGPRTSSDTPTFERLDSARAIMALTHGRYPSWLRTPAADKEAFLNAAALAEKVPVTLAHMPQGLDALQRATPTLLSWCEAHLGPLTTARR